MAGIFGRKDLRENLLLDGLIKYMRENIDTKDFYTDCNIYDDLVWMYNSDTGTGCWATEEEFYENDLKQRDTVYREETEEYGY